MRLCFGILVSICLAPAAFAADPTASAGKPVPVDVSHLRSHTRRLTVSGPRTPMNYAVMKWAEELLERLEAVSDLDPRTETVIRIVVRDDPDRPGGTVHPVQGVDGRRLHQQLQVVNADAVDSGRAREAFAYLFLSQAVWAAYLRNGAGGFESGRRPADIPFWLSEGLAQAVHPGRRAECRREVLALWQSGRLASFRGLVPFERGRTEALEDADANAAARVAEAGMLVMWLLDLPHDCTAMPRVIGRLAAGRAVTCEWFAGWVPGCTTAAELDAAWDRWLLRQKRVVAAPGRTSHEALRLLDAELLLYPGDSGIPLRDGRFRRVTLDSLVERRDEAWMADFCASKCAALTVLAVGRGAAFKEVAAAYCRFLEALRAGRDADEIRRLLEAAERQHDALKATLRENAFESDLKRAEP